MADGRELFQRTSAKIGSKEKNPEVPNCTAAAVKTTRSYHSYVAHSIAFKNKRKKKKQGKN